MHTSSEFLPQMLDSRNLPIQFINLFKQRLEELLFQRFQDHWYTDDLSKGSKITAGIRTIQAKVVLTDALKLTADPVMREAGKGYRSQ